MTQTDEALEALQRGLTVRGWSYERLHWTYLHGTSQWSDAAARELKRRKDVNMNIEKVGSRVALACLAIGGYCFWSCDPTYAATVDAVPVDHSGLAWTIAGLVIGAVALLAVVRHFAGPDPFPTETNPAYRRPRLSAQALKDIDAAYLHDIGDTTGLDVARRYVAQEELAE